MFTTANASEMAVKGNAIRWAKPRVAQTQIATGSEVAESNYSITRLARVREHLDALDQEISDELDKAKPDSKRLKELSDAQTKLEEQERRLSGRPLPGTLRPTNGKTKRQADPVSEPEPAPQVTPEAKPKGYDGPETG